MTTILASAPESEESKEKYVIENLVVTPDSSKPNEMTFKGKIITTGGTPPSSSSSSSSSSSTSATSPLATVGGSRSCHRRRGSRSYRKERRDRKNRRSTRKY